jgi:anti-sigma regulatory factor (Ser/Thr protein kinase)
VIHEIARGENFVDVECARIVLAVDEACTNVIKHCYGGDPCQQLVITATIQPEQLIIQIQDFGPPIDLEKIRPRTLSDVRPGGLGTYFISRIMDKVEYTTVPGSGNVLLLVKYRG